MKDDSTALRLDMALIHSIIRDVSDIVPYDQLEAEHQRDICAWLRSGVNPFRLQKPDIPPQHLVSYFVLIDPEHSSILLVDHIKAQLWVPSGGHVMFNESPYQAVLREIREEFGIPAVFLRNNRKPFFVTKTQTGGLTPGHTDISLWYLLHGSIHDTPRYDRTEFTDVEWYTTDEILETDPVIFDTHMHRFTAKLIGYLQSSDILTP